MFTLCYNVMRSMACLQVLRCRLKWSIMDANDKGDQWDHIDIWCQFGSDSKDFQWVGVSHALEYWVVDLKIPHSCTSVTFAVQPVSVLGYRQPMSLASRVEVSLQSQIQAQHAIE